MYYNNMYTYTILLTQPIVVIHLFIRCWLDPHGRCYMSWTTMKALISALVLIFKCMNASR